MNIDDSLIVGFEYLYDRDFIILTDRIWAILFLLEFETKELVDCILINGHNPTDRACRNNIDKISKIIEKLINKQGE